MFDNQIIFIIKNIQATYHLSLSTLGIIYTAIIIVLSCGFMYLRQIHMLFFAFVMEFLLLACTALFWFLVSNSFI